MAQTSATLARGQGVVPFHRAGFRTRLDHLIFGRYTRRESTRR
jgi:hypothetical protein